MATDPSVRPFIFSFNSFFPHFFIGFSSFTRTRVHKINLCLNSLRICHYAAAATYAQPSNNSRYFYSFDSSAFTFTPLDENTGSAIFFDYFVRFVLVFRFYKSQQQCISLPRSALQFFSPLFGASFFWLDHMCGWKRPKGFYYMNSEYSVFKLKVNFPYDAISFPSAILPNCAPKLEKSRDFYCVQIAIKLKTWIYFYQLGDSPRVKVVWVNSSERMSEWDTMRIPPGIIDGFSHSGASSNTIIPSISAERKSIDGIYHRRIDMGRTEFYAKLFRSDFTFHPRKNQNKYFSLRGFQRRYSAGWAHKMKITCFCAPNRRTQKSPVD